MSNIYIKEPPTNGKVLLHTSMGDIDVELWSKEAPIACRNFVQLCMEDYYNGVIFHRIVSNFIVQGGDPTGTGEGGESIYGKPFKDEFHSRLRFVRRGLVAMANAGPNDNGSQFFFTLASCVDLNKKHTIFGKVTGDTVYNLVRLGEVTTDDNDRPLNPPCIKWTKVLANPFDDVMPRSSAKNKTSEGPKKKKSRMKATKDFKLLSFGEEAAEEEHDLMEFNALHGSTSKSSHDLTNDPKLSSIPVVETGHTSLAMSPLRGKEAGDDKDGEREFDDSGDDKLKLTIVQDKLKSAPPQKKAKIDPTVDETSRSEALRKESRQLAREILSSMKPKKQECHSDRIESSGDNDINFSNPEFAEYKKQQKLYRAKVSSDKGSKRETDTLALLQRFNDKLHSAREDDYNHDDDDDDDDDDDAGWLSHRLEHESELRDAKDMNREVNEDRYALDDPRNPLNKRRREKKSKKEQRR